MELFTENMKLLPMGVIMGLSLLTVQTAQASSTFSSNATVTYTITGNVSGVQIQGLFKQAAPPDYYVATSGDGTVTANNPDVGPIVIGGSNSFSNNFAVSGSVNNGTVTSHHQGNFDVKFTNTDTVSHLINVKLDYQLNAAASGEFADSNVTVDYFNGNNSFTGQDAVNASVFALANVSKSGSSGLFNFTLAPNVSEHLYAYLTINGNLEAAQVPVPGAFWLFASAMAGMGVIGRRKNKPCTAT